MKFAIDLFRSRRNHGLRFIQETFAVLAALCCLLVPFSSSAFEPGAGKELQTYLEKSRSLLLTMQSKLRTNTSVASEMHELKSTTEHLRSSHNLTEKRLTLREEKVRSLGSTAAGRHKAVSDKYRTALTEYLRQMDRLTGTEKQTQSAMKEKIGKLQAMLDKMLPSKKRPLIGSLPYKLLNYPAREPSSAPSTTPAYRGGIQSTGVNDVAGTIEAPISTETASLARSLNWSPVLIYDYVKNTVDTEWYWGCMKGAEETLRQKSGNDCDQAALLVALLRASGYPTRYVRGTIEFFPDIRIAQNMTGIDDPAQIAAFFQKAGIPFKTVLNGSAITNFQIEHLWVETYVPYSNYRGAVLDDQGKMWLGLDTSIKAGGYTYNAASDILSGLSLSSVRDEYLNAVRTEMPLDYLKSRIHEYLVQSHPTATYSDYVRTKTLNAQVMNILPSTMQIRQVKITNEFTTIPDELKHKVTFRATDAANAELFAAAFDTLSLSNKSVSVTFEPETVDDQAFIDSWGGIDNTPAYLVRLRPVLTVDNEQVAAGLDGLAMGSDYTLTITLTSPAGTEQVSNTLVAGNIAVIGLSAQKVATTPSPPGGEGEKDAERMLYETAQHYIDRWNKAEDEIASLLHLAVARPLPTVVTLGGVVDVDYLLNVPHGMTWKGEYIDADFRATEAVYRTTDPGDRTRLFMQLSSLQGSALEHKVFEDDLGVSSIATAKLMQLANTPPATTILTIDQSNIAAILPTLSFDQNVKDDIQNAVNQNFSIRIPQSEMTYQDWTGVGYLKENPVTGEAGWMLSGMIAGGMTTVSLGRWSSDYTKTILGNPYYDDTRSIYITYPANESIVTTSTVMVTGAVLDSHATVTVNGIRANVEGNTFSAMIILTPGNNTIIAVLAVSGNAAGRSTFDVIAVQCKLPVMVVITYPFDGAELSVSPIYVEGIVSDPTTTVYVSGSRATTSFDGRFITNNISLIEGTNQITASATNADGEIDSQSISITYHAVQPQPSLIVSISTPTAGAIINKPVVTIEGTITTTAIETGVLVNGLPATLYNNQFVVNNIPLTNGSNRIIVNAMDSNGAMTRAETTVIADTTAPYVQLNANITSGIAPLTAYFTVSTSLTNTIISYQMDFNGNGTNDYTGPTFDNISNTFITEGIYFPKITVTDSKGNVYTDSISMIINNKSAIETVMKDKWMNIRTALMAGDVEKALKGFVVTSQQRYRDVFAQIGGSRINAMFSGITDLKIISQNENIADCDLLRQESRGTVAYPVTFIQDSNGMWKVFGF